MQFARRLFCLLVLVALASARGETVKLGKPVPVAQKRTDKTKIVGRIVSYDEDGFDVEPPKKAKADVVASERVKWEEIDAKTAYAVRKSLIDPKDVTAHVELGRTMLDVRGGKEWAEKAFAIALRFDPSVKKIIEEI